MKTPLRIVLLLSALLTGCADHKTINGATYVPYGLANADEIKNPNIAYEIPVENVIVGILFSETIVIPIYIIGWDLYQPVGVKPPKGQDPK